MNGPTPRRLLAYACRRLGLGRYLARPGDGRSRPQIPAYDLVWALLAGVILRECSFRAIEALVQSPARRALAVGRGFGDDALGYFCERLAPERTRVVLAEILRRAKRNKAFAGQRIGLALDGTGEAGLRVVARLKANLPELWEEARTRFLGAPPTWSGEIAGEHVDLWDAADFDPWETLR